MTGPVAAVDATRAPVTLVVDVGGTSVKLRASDWAGTVRIPSGHTMGPEAMRAAVHATVAGRHYDRVSLGYPGPVRRGRPVREPHNLAAGWTAFDFEAAFGAPVRALNDAAMQALGNYRDRPMLFLGFGTGLGSAIVIDASTVMPLELAHLPYVDGGTFEDFVGARGRERLGDAAWRDHCLRVMQLLGEAMQAEEIVVGGGNARRLLPLPDGARPGEADAAFRGGLQLWGNARG